MESRPCIRGGGTTHTALRGAQPGGRGAFLFRQEKEEEARESDGYFHHQNAVRGARLFALQGIRAEFIVNPGICPKIAEAAGIDERFGVLEVGPGVGVLTKELARRAKK